MAAVQKLEFSKIGKAVAAQFAKMSTLPLFRVNIDKQTLVSMYLESFPEGTNPIYRTRTEHDCQGCRHFIRDLGGVVNIVNGKLVTIWDIQTDEPAYQVVADAVAELVREYVVADIFLYRDASVGTAKTFEWFISGDRTDHVKHSWDHFHVSLPRIVVANKKDIPTKLNDARTTRAVFLRSLQEIATDAVDTVLELIDQGSLYRGDEQKHAVSEFLKVKREFDKIGTPIPADVIANADVERSLRCHSDTDARRELFAWEQYGKHAGSIARIRNTAIGTLLVNLSEGMELENAVKAFESIMAPANYKRPKSLVTKAMIDKAKETLTDLGLVTALERRYATFEDITVNNLLFVDRSGTVRGDVFDDLTNLVPHSSKRLDKVEEVSIEKFLMDIVPKAETIEVMVENHHTGNLVSLIAPVDPTSARLFKWPNKFSWSYNGEFADSIKERVKAAGGNVTGEFRASLSWYNYDDLDLSLKEPGIAERIYFGHKRSVTGGQLDVDMNAGSGTSRTPVENIFYERRSQMKEGTYTLFVHQYNHRESQGGGFEVELEFDGVTYNFSYPKPVNQNQSIAVVKFSYAKKEGLKIIESLPMSQASKTVWNVPTHTLRKVKALMLSPNYWGAEGELGDEVADARAARSMGIGNKHYFFMLEGCVNDGKARGFFNEFLSSDLDKHRKVLEMVGSKMRTEESDRQLSGVGFSSTQRNSIMCRVSGKFTRVVKVTF